VWRFTDGSLERRRVRFRHALEALVRHAFVAASRHQAGVSGPMVSVRSCPLHDFTVTLPGIILASSSDAWSNISRSNEMIADFEAFTVLRVELIVITLSLP
jgi:hypothetical protein